MNCVSLPTEPDRAFVLGVALYSDKHPSYDEFVITRLKQLEERGVQTYLAAEKKLLQSEPRSVAEEKAEEFAAIDAARSLRGLISFLRLALQVDGIKEAKITHKPLLILNDNDPHLAF